MRVLILTSSRKGTASFFLPRIIEASSAQIVAVIYNRQTEKKNAKFYKRKLKKVFKIGLWGTWNGLRMRKWYTADVTRLAQIEDIEILCERFGIALHVVDGINNDNTLRILREANADLGISLGNSYISKRIFTVPQQGMINLHGELLPQFKNAQSVIWQLYEGNTTTGYTIHEINSKIDDGSILKREEIPIIFKPTLSETVTYNCVQILKHSCNGMIEILNNLPVYLKSKSPQNGGKSYTTPNLIQYIRIKRNFDRIRNRRN